MKRLLWGLLLLALVCAPAFAGLVGVGSGPTSTIPAYYTNEYNAGNCSGTGGSALAINFTLYSHQFFTITANCEITVTDPTTTALRVVSGSMCWTQGGAGGYTLTLPANFKWNNATAPSWGTTLNDDNCLYFQYRQADDVYVATGVADY